MEILIIDDDTSYNDFLSEELQRVGFNCSSCFSVGEAKTKIVEKKYDAILVDMKLKDGDGLDILSIIKKHNLDSKVIIVTGHGSIKNAVVSMKCGANEYFEKPVDIFILQDRIKSLVKSSNDRIKNNSEENTISLKDYEDNLGVFVSPAMQKMISEIKKVASKNVSVFLNGETGVGKEVIANLIHRESERSKNRMVSINCASIPDHLVESELFGCKKGAFTGAGEDRIGKFEYAQNGTLLLDEITEMPKNAQAKILRIIQEQKFNRLGCNKTYNLDVRFISTSNREMKDAIKEGFIREDLFYRLNVIEVKIPSLRERKDDILPLCDFFIKKFSKKHDLKVKKLNKISMNKSLEYDWPGNVRELSNVIERSVILSKDDKAINISFNKL